MIVKPFQGVRPDKKFVSKFHVPPYDVVSLEDVRRAVRDNPESFFHVTRSEVDLPEGTDEHSAGVYDKARNNFMNFLESGVLRQDMKKGFYILSQQWQGRTQTGLVAAVSCAEYESNLIKKHELTRKDKEEDRTNHIGSVKADTGPVFLAFEKIPGFENWIAEITNGEPEYDETDENQVRNRLWIADQKEMIDTIERYFLDIPAFYIADGHHRAASAVNLWKKKKDSPENQDGLYDHFLAAVFPSSDLKILPYNRIVTDLNGLSEEEFLKNIGRNFKVSKSPGPEPSRKGDIRLITRSGFYNLQLNEENISGDPSDSLDVAVLQNYILSPVLGIGDPRVSRRIGFIGGIKGTGELVRLVSQGEAAAAFSLFPVSMKELMAVVGSGKIMPPKSTWFEPKLRDGLVIYRLESGK